MPKTVAYEAKIEHLSILDEHAKFDAKLGKGLLSDDEVAYLYEQISISRHYDEIAFKLQRSGRMGTYPQNKGQEACAAGPGYVLQKRREAGGFEDWIVPCYRENLALFMNGLPMEKILLHWMGDERGNQIPDGVNILPIAIPIGTHPLHASGLAWSLKYRKQKGVALCFFGDGATSEGDFHEGMNFASALKLPVVFISQNNFWAISVPREKQTGSQTIAQKGLAYGMPCFQCDGNDIFATYKTAKDAIEYAEKESRPVFIEMITYRLGDHTTADDARRYRDEKELASWQHKDPLIRMRTFLEGKGKWDDAKQEAMEAKAKELVSQVVKNAEGIADPTVDDVFNWTFAELPEEIIRQRETLRTSSLGQHPEQETLAPRTYQTT